MALHTDGILERIKSHCFLAWEEKPYRHLSLQSGDEWEDLDRGKVAQAGCECIAILLFGVHGIWICLCLAQQKGPMRHKKCYVSGALQGVGGQGSDVRRSEYILQLQRVAGD